MSSESNKEYSVNWKNHMDHVRKAFADLLSDGELVDVTMCCEGKKIGAHKLLLSACSSYFREIFKDVPCSHPVIFLKGVEYGVLVDILHFIYNGEVSVDTANLDSFLKTAQLLQISGLTDSDNDKLTSQLEQNHSGNNSNNNGNEVEESQIVANPVSKVIASSSNNTQASNRVNKRARETKDVGGEVLPDKKPKHLQETLFLTHVKTEPSEILNFEENIEDPLESDLKLNDNNDYYGSPSIQNVPDEEFKSIYNDEFHMVHISKNIESENIKYQAFKQGRYMCYNNYKYLVDKKDYSNKRIYLRCNRHRHERCTGRLITDLDYNVIRISVAHLHEPDY